MILISKKEMLELEFIALSKEVDFISTEQDKKILSLADTFICGTTPQAGILRVYSKEDIINKEIYISI